MSAIDKATLIAKIDSYFTTNGAQLITGAQANEIVKDLTQSYANKIDDVKWYSTSDYNPARSYVEGMTCIASGTLKRANQSTTGTYNAAHWDNVFSEASGTPNKYAKFTASGIDDALLSDDGTQVILPSGKYITSQATDKIRMSFGTTGSEFFELTTAGGSYSESSVYIDADGISLGWGGTNKANLYIDDSRSTLIKTITGGSKKWGLSVAKAGFHDGLRGGIYIVDNVSAGFSDSGFDPIAAVLINTKNGTINSGVIGSVVFGNGRTASADYTAYFTNADIAGVFKYVDGNQASGKVLTSDASGNVSWQTNAALLSGLTLNTIPIATSATTIGDGFLIQTANSVLLPNGKFFTGVGGLSRIDLNDAGLGGYSTWSSDAGVLAEGWMAINPTSSSLNHIGGSIEINTTEVNISGIKIILASPTEITGTLALNSIDTTATAGTDTLNVGTTNADVINIGRSGATVNILGAVINEYATNAYVTDKLITLNSGGAVSSGIGVGFEIEENAVINGYFKTVSSRDGFAFLTPAVSYELTLSLASLGANRTLTVPNVSGTIITTGDSGTVTNTMLAGSIAASKLVGTDIVTVGTITAGTWGAGAVIGGATVTLGSDATGDIYCRNAGGVLSRLAAGAVGTVLIGQGAGVVPGYSSSPQIGKLTAYPGVQTTLGTGPGLVIGDNGSNGGVNNLYQIGFHYSTANIPGCIIGGKQVDGSNFGRAEFFVATRSVTTNTAPTERFRIDGNGNVGIGRTSLTAYLDIKAGVATAGGAIMNFEPGTVLTTMSANKLEYDGTSLFFTNSGAQRQQLPQVQNTRVSTQFDKTNDASLANITGLSATLVAGKTYEFEAILYVAADATGGSQYAIGGTCTATNIIYETILIDNTSDLITIAAGASAIGGSNGQAGTTDGFCKIKGTITVNAAGTLTVQFAQNTATAATTSSVLVGSTFKITQIP